MLQIRKISMWKLFERIYYRTGNGRQPKIIGIMWKTMHFSGMNYGKKISKIL